MPQPTTTGLVIPKSSPDSAIELKSINFNTSSIESMLEMFFKFSKKDKELLAQKTAELIEHNKKIENYSKPNPAEDKKKKGLSKYFDKWFVKKDFLKTLGGFFRKLIDRAGGWLTDLLKFLLFFAFFDPKGTFLTSIINFLIGILETVLSTIIKWLPVIAVRMWNLFWKVLVPGFGRLGKMIGTQLFGADSALTTFLEKLGKFIPILVVILGVLSKLEPFLPIFKFLGKGLGLVFKGLLSLGVMLMNFFFPGVLLGIKMLIAGFLAGTISFGAMAAAIWAMVWPVLAVVAAIALVVAGFYFLWKYAGKVSDFFDGLIDRFKKLGRIGKTIVVVIAALLWPLTTFIALIYGLAKLFKSIKKIGFKATMKLIYDAIAKWLKGVSFTKILLAVFLSIPGLLIKALISGAGSLLSWFGNFLGKLLKSLWPEGFDGLMSGIGLIKDFIGGIWDWIKAFSIDPMAFIRGNEMRKTAAKMTVQAQNIAEKGGTWDGGKGGNIAEVAGMDASQILKSQDLNKKILAQLEIQTAQKTDEQKTQYLGGKVISSQKAAKTFETDWELRQAKGKE